jgi:aryl-alcohol dehydrogenase-like predicted oxidoreductase
VVGTFDGLRAAGLIRRVGASVKGPRVTPDTLALARTYMATGRIDALQVIFSVLRPQMSALWSETQARGVTVVARTVLESGFLTGKFPPGHAFPPGDHRHRWPAHQLEPLLETVRDAGTGLAAMAIRYALTPPAVNVIIPGAKTPEQVEANWRAATAGPLSAAELAGLDRHCAPIRAFANPPPID